MADWDMSPEEYLEEIETWTEEYGIDFTKSIGHEEMTQAQHEMLKKLDKEGLVWTEHSTCEDSMYSPGFKIFGDCKLLNQEASGCGCWQSYAYHIGTEPCSEYDFRNATLESTGATPPSKSAPWQLAHSRS